MAILYVGSTTGNGSNADYSVSLDGTLTGGLASSPATNDIVVVVMGTSGMETNKNLAITGFTELTDLSSGGTYVTELYVGYKIMGATPDTSFTATGSGSASYGSSTVVHVWRGVDLNTPIDVTTTTGVASSYNDVNYPSITPTTNGAVVIAIGAGLTDSTPQAKVLRHTALYGEKYGIQAVGSGTSKSLITSAISFCKITAGAFDMGEWLGGESTSGDTWCGASIALRPATACPITYITASSPQSATTGATTVTMPTHISDDILILAIESQANEATLSTASGFVKLGSTVSATGTRLDVFWVRATSNSMTAPVIGANSDHAYCSVAVFRGCRTSGNPFSSYVTDIKNTASTTTTFPSITTQAIDDLVIGIGTSDTDSTSERGGEFSNNNLEGSTYWINTGTTSGDGGGIYAFYSLKGSIGATGTNDVTVNSCTSAIMTLGLTTAPATSLSKVGGLAYASVSKVESIAISNVGKVGGLE